MADSGQLNAQLDIYQILPEAKHRWMHPAEICEILRNYEKFRLSPEPPNRPSSGTLFLFDRKVQRHFRKDGYNWMKKKDGKTLKEANEKLKVERIDALHCYYAHGEEDQNFQRRSYWMLEEGLSHIVLVHYRDVKELYNTMGSCFPHPHSAPPMHSDHQKQYIDQILPEAKHRWMHPAEICEILRNYEKFHLSPEPPNRPSSGSLFLFDRKVLRYFRKDGHNWRKKSDGKTVKEVHETLKAGSIDVLRCYYAQGEEDQNFQRRIYWMLEGELSHIVLVHYREVKANRTNFNRIRESEVIPDSQNPRENSHTSEVDISVSSEIRPSSYEGTLQVVDSASLYRAHASAFKNAETVYCYQQSPGFQSFDNVQQPMVQKIRDGSIPYCDVPISGMSGMKFNKRAYSDIDEIPEFKSQGKSNIRFKDTNVKNHAGPGIQGELKLSIHKPITDPSLELLEPLSKLHMPIISECHENSKVAMSNRSSSRLSSLSLPNMSSDDEFLNISPTTLNAGFPNIPEGLSFSMNLNCLQDQIKEKKDKRIDALQEIYDTHDFHGPPCKRLNIMNEGISAFNVDIVQDEYEVNSETMRANISEINQKVPAAPLSSTLVNIPPLETNNHRTSPSCIKAGTPPGISQEFPVKAAFQEALTDFLHKSFSNALKHGLSNIRSWWDENNLFIQNVITNSFNADPTPLMEHMNVLLKDVDIYLSERKQYLECSTTKDNTKGLKLLNFKLEAEDSVCSSLKNKIDQLTSELDKLHDELQTHQEKKNMFENEKVALEELQTRDVSITASIDQKRKILEDSFLQLINY